MSTYGPDECQMAELENGTIICEHLAATFCSHPLPSFTSLLLPQTMGAITGSETPGAEGWIRCLGTAVSTAS